MFTGFGDTPLDVIAQGDGQIFAGTIWSVVYGGNGVTIFEPVGTPTTCTGDNDNFNLDDDGDGYSNGDETVNRLTHVPLPVNQMILIWISSQTWLIQMTTTMA